MSVFDCTVFRKKKPVEKARSGIVFLKRNKLELLTLSWGKFCAVKLEQLGQPAARSTWGRRN
jgi:hypothetical protein